MILACIRSYTVCLVRCDLKHINFALLQGRLKKLYWDSTPCLRIIGDMTPNHLGEQFDSIQTQRGPQISTKIFKLRISSRLPLYTGQ